MLATSRAPLGLTSEAVYPLPELGLDTSVELFTQRARAARPGVELPPDAVAELCRHLDGLPLAVELAAARVRVLSVPEIARRLGDRFALLRGGARDAPERHRTLHAVVDWSWNLLARGRQGGAARAVRLPRRLHRRGGGAACSGEDALFLLEQLADQSLLKVADTPAGVRFRMLETVREFSAARRAEAGEDEEVIGRFLAWARDFGVAYHDCALRLGAAGRLGADQGRAGQPRAGPAARPGPYGRPHHRRRSPPSSPPCGPPTPTTPASSPWPRTPARRCRTTAPSPNTSKSPAPPRCCARRACSWATARTPSRQLVTLRRLPPAPPDRRVRSVDRYS